MDTRPVINLDEVSISRKALAERVRVSTDRAVGGVHSSVLGTVLLAWIQAPVAGWRPALVWFLCINVVELLVLRWGHQYRNANPTDQEASKWVRRQVLGAGMLGLAWGSSVWFFWVDGRILAYMLNLTVLVTVTAITLTIVAPFASATLLFTATILLPVLAHLAVVHNPFTLQIIAGLLVLFAIQLRYAAIARGQLVDGLETAVRNFALVEQLQSRERQMAIAQQLSSTGSWVYDRATARVMASAECLRIFGHLPVAGDISPMEIEASIPDVEPFRRAVRALVAQGQGFDLRFWIHPADGSAARFVHAIGRNDERLSDTHRVMGFVQDITQSKHAEELLRASEARYRLLADNATDVIWSMNVDGKFTYLSPSIERLSGYTCQDIMARDLTPACPSATFLITQEAIDTLLLAIASGKPIVDFQVELERQRKDGSTLSLETTATAMTGVDGEFIGILGNTRDITWRRQAALALSNEKNLLRNILDSIPDVIFIKDHAGVYIECNRAFEQFLGQPRGARIGKTEFDFRDSKAAERIRIHDSNVLASGSVFRTEQWVTNVQGHRLLMDVNYAPLRGLDGRCDGLIGISRDITERHEAEVRLLESDSALQRSMEELQVAKARAEAANNAKSRFLAAASHDLRQPLAALTLYVGMLGNAPYTGIGRLTSRIEDCVANMSGLLTDLLDVGKLEAGAIKPKLTDFRVDSVVEKLTSIYNGTAKDKGLQMRVRSSNRTIRTDKELLRRILNNLIVNAVAFTQSGGVLIACRPKADLLWIEVWDTGIGFDEGKVDFIFEEYRQLAESSGNSGSGLGLAIVGKMTALLGLPMRVRSRPGRGSLFAVGVPYGEQLQSTDQLHAPSIGRRLRIALVDDDVRVLDALRLTLEALGHEVVPSTTEAGLMDLLQGEAPDFILSDYRLAKGKFGFQVISAVRSAFDSTLPALILTGDTDPKVISEMSQKGIDVAYKPLATETLLALISKATDRRQGRALDNQIAGVLPRQA